MQYILGILTQSEMSKKIHLSRHQHSKGSSSKCGMGSPPAHSSYINGPQELCRQQEIRTEREISFLLESYILLSWGWRRDSAVKDARFPGRGHGFSSQHSLGGSQISDALFWPHQVLHTWCIDTQVGKILKHTHKIFKILYILFLFSI